MCPDSVSMCFIGNWSLIVEAVVVSMIFGLVVGAVVGLAVNLIEKK
ncbi:MAG: hypothetical protein WCX69_04690 [Candidatus Paceibacterota bacterium]